MCTLLKLTDEDSKMLKYSTHNACLLQSIRLSFSLLSKKGELEEKKQSCDGRYN